MFITSLSEKSGRSPFSHLSYPNPNSYPNLTLTLNLTLTNPNPTLTLTLRRVTKVQNGLEPKKFYLPHLH